MDESTAKDVASACHSRDEVNLHTIESSGDHLRLLERKRTAAAKAASIEIRQNDHCKCALACARTDLRLRPVAVGVERAPNLETGAAGRAAATATPAAKSMTFMTMVIFLGSYTDFRGRGHLWWLHLSSAATWHKVQGVKIAVNSVILRSKSDIRLKLKSEIRLKMEFGPSRKVLDPRYNPDPFVRREINPKRAVVRSEF